MSRLKIKSHMLGPYPLTPQMVDFYVTRICGGYYRLMGRDGRSLWGIAPDVLSDEIARWHGQFDVFFFCYFDDDDERTTDEKS